MQAFLVLPAFALAYLVAGRPGCGSGSGTCWPPARAWSSSAGWYVLLVALWPADSRPYIGGSPDQLAVGAGHRLQRPGPDLRRSGNGGRRCGRRRRAAAAAAPASAARPGSAGCSAPRSAREISWLLPAALIALVAGLWFTRRLPADRPDPGRAAALGRLAAGHRAGLLLHGGHHPPLLHGRAGAGDRRRRWRSRGRELWRGRRSSWSRRIVLAAMIAATGVWSFVLLGRTPTWLPWLRWVVLVGALVGAALLVLSGRAAAPARRRRPAGRHRWPRCPGRRPTRSPPRPPRTPAPSRRPARPGPAMGGFGGRRPAARGRGAGGTARAAAPTDGSCRRATTAGRGADRVAETACRRAAPTGADATEHAGRVRRRRRRCDHRQQRAGRPAERDHHPVVGGRHRRAVRGRLHPGHRHRGDGRSAASPAATRRRPWRSSRQYVADGEISYFIAGGGGGGGGGRRRPRRSTGSGSEIQAWVEANFTATTVGGTTVYDLTSSTGS